jgi:hypothetical protein
MWLVEYLPNFVTHFIVLAGIIGILLTSLPLIWRLVPGLEAYRLLIQLVGIACLGFGLYLEGGLAMEAEYKVKVAELKEKLKDAEIKAANANAKIITEYVTKKQYIKQRGDTITEYIDREVVKYDKNCPIPIEVIKAHNAAALNDPIMLVSTDDHNKLAVPGLKLAPKKK